MRPQRPDSTMCSASSSTVNGYARKTSWKVRSGGVSGMRQRTSRPSVFVSSNRTPAAQSHRRPGSAAAARRWCVRMVGSGSQSSRLGMRFTQGKREAYWFYRFVSPLYDRWVNPLFWTPELRTAALALARLDDPRLRTLDVGAGTGFSTVGIVERVAAGAVTMLDQSHDQLRRADAKPEL